MMIPANLQPTDFVHLPPHAGTRQVGTASWPWLRAASAYFLVAVLCGLGMATVHDFRLMPLHAHLNLLGWVSPALFGLVLERVPSLARSRVTRIHFIVWQLTLPVMMFGLAGLLLGHAACEPVVAASSTVIVADVAMFAAAVWWHTRGAERARAGG